MIFDHAAEVGTNQRFDQQVFRRETGQQVSKSAYCLTLLNQNQAVKHSKL